MHIVFFVSKFTSYTISVWISYLDFQKQHRVSIHTLGCRNEGRVTIVNSIGRDYIQNWKHFFVKGRVTELCVCMCLVFRFTCLTWSTFDCILSLFLNSSSFLILSSQNSNHVGREWEMCMLKTKYKRSRRGSPLVSVIFC